MALSDSALEPEALAYARGLLKPPVTRDSIWPVVGAGGLLAAALFGLAFAMLTAPPPGAVEPTVKKAISEQALDAS